MVGWLPGAVLGAASLAGVLGALGLLVGAIVAIVKPVSSGDVEPDGALVLARVRPSERDAVVATIQGVGGTITALG
jgi:hypothetical protein